MSGNQAGGPRVWIVTGGSRGYGRAIAERAAATGDRVAILARNGDVAQVAKEIDGEVIGLSADVRDTASVEQAVGDVVERWGRVDVVVNNAGLHRGGLVAQLDAADWADVLATNLTGPFHTIRAALPHMTAGGSIVNIGAVVGFRGFAGDAPYGASKAGLAGLTQVLAVELARQGIRVNLVIPGFTSTEMTAGVSEQARRRLLERVPMGREGTPEETAEVVWWVAGSTYMTGSVITADGGLSCML